MQRSPVPPFTKETALVKVQAAEDAWNSRNPARVAQAYTPESEWRNRDEFFVGRDAIEAFLSNKWSRELHYRLMKELWAFTDNRISVRFEYEWQLAPPVNPLAGRVQDLLMFFLGLGQLLFLVHDPLPQLFED